MRISADRNERFYGSSLRFYDDADEVLLPIERQVIERPDISWPDIRMLDIGVGAGRTTRHFAPLVREYVGIDYSAELVEHCRGLFGDTDSRRFETADARRLSELSFGTFDFVLFSFNGIDYASYEDRHRILRGVNASLQDTGWFFFSSHSLLGASTWWPSPKLSFRQPLRSMVGFGKAVIKVPRLVWSNRHVSLSAAKQRGHAIIEDGAYRFGVETYYIDPVQQVRQLDEAGFDLEGAYTTNGHRIVPQTTSERGWISYLARPKRGSADR